MATLPVAAARAAAAKVRAEQLKGPPKRIIDVELTSFSGVFAHGHDLQTALDVAFTEPHPDDPPEMNEEERRRRGPWEWRDLVAPPVFLTADHHFGHQKVLGMSGRPFASVAEHDEYLIEAWNASVGPNDTVWHLGDFAYRCTAEHAAQVFSRLNGIERLVHGNHEEHGHTHGLLPDTRQSCDVGVDRWQYRPALFADVLARPEATEALPEEVALGQAQDKKRKAKLRTACSGMS